MMKGTKGVETSLLEPWSTGVSGPVETVPRSRRREANSPDVSCLCGTWKPQWGLPWAVGAPEGDAEAPVGQDGQEAKADGRKAQGIHNLSDRALPNLKGC
jgi:hypothetical protein